MPLLPCRMSRVLVISETLQEAEQIHHMLASANLKDVTFRYPESLGHEPSDPQSLLKDCIGVIKEENIDTVLSIIPRHTLIHAALLTEYPNLTGPSFESTFLCLHRYYTKELISNGFNLMCTSVDMEDMANEATGLTGVFEETGSPVWVKDAYRLDGCLVKKVKGFSHFKRVLDTVKSHLKQKLDNLKPLLLDNLDRKKYPNAFEPSCVVEQYLAFAKQAFSFHYVEGCIADKSVIPWAISDVFYLRQKPKRVQYMCVPSRLPESTQYQVWGVFRELAQRLVPYGFNNQFIHCEVLVTKNGVVKVSDIVPTVNRQVTPLYRQVLQGGDNIKAQIEVGMGQMQMTPRALPYRAAMLGQVHITKSGTRLGDVVDVKAARATSGVTVHITNEDHVIDTNTDDGEHVFDVSTCESTMESCLRINREISNGVLKGNAHRDDFHAQVPKPYRRASKFDIHQI